MFSPPLSVIMTQTKKGTDKFMSSRQSIATSPKKTERLSSKAKSKSIKSQREKRAVINRTAKGISELNNYIDLLTLD